MTYSELNRVASAFADLLAQRPDTAQLPTVQQAQAALVCRDAVVAELRALTREVLRIGPTAALDRDSDLAVLGASPAHALHTALVALPAATDKSLPLPAALSLGARVGNGQTRSDGGATDAASTPQEQASPLLRAWQDAARAATGLERHLTQARTLDDTDAWQTLRIVADLAAALPALDADLADALPSHAEQLSPALPKELPRELASGGGLVGELPTDLDGAALAEDSPLLGVAAGLHDISSHTLIRVAAEELRAQTADLPHPALRQPTTVATIGLGNRPERAGTTATQGGLADLPAATEHLAALVRRRGKDLTAVEASATSRVLADGLALTARVLNATSGPYGPGRDLAAHLQQTVPALQAVANGTLATLTPPSRRLQHLAGGVREQLRAIAGLADRLDKEPDGRHHLQRLAPLLTAWATQAATAAAAVDRALKQADADNRLLTLRTDTARGKHENLTWIPLNGHRGQTSHPTLAAAERASTLLAAARTPLAHVSTSDRADTSISTSTTASTRAGNASQTTSTSSSAAVPSGRQATTAAQLRAALRQRNATPPPVPRSGHPAAPPLGQPTASRRTPRS